MNAPKNLLIVRTDRIGDVVLSLPMASIIKKHFPECRVTYLLRKYTEPLAVNNQNIDEVLTLIEENGKPAVGKNIAQLKDRFDACIVAFPTYAISLILFLSNIKNRIGTGYRWYSFLFNKKVYDHRKYGEHHELEYNIRMLKQLGIDEQVNESNARFGLSADHQLIEKVKTDLKNLKADLSKKIVIVHPGSGGSAVDLPNKKLKEIVKLLSQEKIQIILTGSESEANLCQSFIVEKNIISTAGNYKLDRLIALISFSDLFISNSTGPLHIASALQKNVIGFYPKFTAASPKRWGPYTNKKMVFVPALNCTNCTRKQCEQLNCMDSINVQDVVNEAKKFLEIR